MGMFKALYEAYELIKKRLDDGSINVYYTSYQPFYSIKINLKGDFKKYETLKKKSIFVPCSESSASRSSGCAPHPLFDSFKYIATPKKLTVLSEKLKKLCLDFNIDSTIKEQLLLSIDNVFGNYINLNEDENYYKEYVKLLSNWVEFTNEKPQIYSFLNAILKYVKSESVLNDIDFSNSFEEIFLKKLTIKSSSKEIETSLEKWLTKTALKYNVEFEVIDSELDIKSPELALSWADFYESINFEGEKFYSSISGEKTFIAQSYPKKIRNDGDQTKLVSSNDKNLVYLGRFTDSSQVAKIGMRESQKIHKALSWLLRNASIHIDSQYTAIWSSYFQNEEKLPHALDSDPFAIFLDSDKSSDDKNLMCEYKNEAKKIYKGALKVLSNKLKFNNQKVYVLSVDACTPGRLSVTRFLELDGVDYLKAIDQWIDDLAILKNNNEYYFPNFNNLWKSLNIVIKHKDFMIRILDAIINNKNIPKEYISLMFHAIKHQSSKDNIYRNINAVASVVKCFYIRKGVLISMSLDVNFKDRSYLFGRLLAITDNIEGRVNKINNSQRSTNSIRLMPVMLDKPFESWKNIEKAISPYVQRLESSQDNGLRAFIFNRKRLMDEIMNMFSPQDFSAREKLDSMFLLGFHHQRVELFNSNKSDDK